MADKQWYEDTWFSMSPGVWYDGVWYPYANTVPDWYNPNPVEEFKP